MADKTSLFWSLLTSAIDLYTPPTLTSLLLLNTLRTSQPQGFCTCFSVSGTFFSQIFSSLVPSILSGLFRGFPCPAYLKSSCPPAHLFSPPVCCLAPRAPQQRPMWTNKGGGIEGWPHTLSSSWNTSGSERGTTNNYTRTRGLTGT